jgi:Protein of unknown function (DUF2846)
MFAMAQTEIPRRWLLWASGLLLIVAGCVESPATVPAAAPPIASGQARVWFYRSWEPSESLDLALIDMNGSYVGAVENGGAFYRDVPPGHYRIAPESFGRDTNQDRNVDLAPGQLLYVKVVSLESWGESVSSCKNCARDAFYAWLIPPEVAQAEIARDRAGI